MSAVSARDRPIVWKWLTTVQWEKMNGISLSFITSFCLSLIFLYPISRSLGGVSCNGSESDRISPHLSIKSAPDIHKQCNGREITYRPIRFFAFSSAFIPLCGQYFPLYASWSASWLYRCLSGIVGREGRGRKVHFRRTSSSRRLLIHELVKKLHFWVGIHFPDAVLSFVLNSYPICLIEWYTVVVIYIPEMSTVQSNLMISGREWRPSVCIRFSSGTKVCLELRDARTFLPLFHPFRPLTMPDCPRNAPFLHSIPPEYIRSQKREGPFHLLNVRTLWCRFSLNGRSLCSLCVVVWFQ